MKKILNYLMLLLVTTLSLTFASCGGDNDEPDEPNIPGTEKPDNSNNSEYDGYVAEGSYIYIRYNTNDYYASIRPLGNSFSIKPNYYFCERVKTAFIGNYKRIEEIKGLNGNYEWKTDECTFNNVKERDCFIIEVTAYGTSYYYIYQFGPSKKNLSGDVIGYYYNLQSYNAI